MEPHSCDVKSNSRESLAETLCAPVSLTVQICKVTFYALNRNRRTPHATSRSVALVTRFANNSLDQRRDMSSGISRDSRTIELIQWR